MAILRIVVISIFLLFLGCDDDGGGGQARPFWVERLPRVVLVDPLPRTFGARRWVAITPPTPEYDFWGWSFKGRLVRSGSPDGVEDLASEVSRLSVGAVLVLGVHPDAPHSAWSPMLGEFIDNVPEIRTVHFPVANAEADAWGTLRLLVVGPHDEGVGGNRSVRAELTENGDQVLVVTDAAGTRRSWTIPKPPQLLAGQARRDLLRALNAPIALWRCEFGAADGQLLITLLELLRSAGSSRILLEGREFQIL